jgi:hypothetical protein
MDRETVRKQLSKVTEPVLPAAVVVAANDFAPPIDLKGLLTLALPLACLGGWALSLRYASSRAPQDRGRRLLDRPSVALALAIVGVLVMLGLFLAMSERFIDTVGGKRDYVGFESDHYQSAETRWRQDPQAPPPTRDDILSTLKRWEQADGESRPPWKILSRELGIVAVWSTFLMIPLGTTFIACVFPVFMEAHRR